MTLDGYCEIESIDEWCSLHECQRPCEHCKADDIDRRYEEMVERRGRR